MECIDQILDLHNLRLAWEEVADRGGAAGVDQVSIKRWQRNHEERLVGLAGSVRRRAYRPRPPRTVYIPKKDGSLREISILTVTDRVLQRAVLRVVDDLFDQTFLDCSFGYRAGKSLRNAVPAILLHRDLGRLWVLDADIDACFDSLPHAVILREFKKTVDDPAVLRLLQLWLGARRSPVGISMGAVISPLLCNLVLNVLDQHLVAAGFHPVRYADDFCIFCGNEEEARRAAACTEAVLAALELALEPRKTRITHFNEGFDFLGIRFHRNTYSFTAGNRKIEVRGSMLDHPFMDLIPPGYEG